MGLMSRILSRTGSVAGEGLLKKALELRQVAQDAASEPVPAGERQHLPADQEQVEAEKKKPLRRFSTRAA